MSYWMTKLESTTFRIEKENMDGAFNALLDFLEKKAKSEFKSFNRNEYEKIQDAFSELGWYCVNPFHLDYIDYIDFCNDELTDEAAWMMFIAPYVTKGSHIDMMGDDEHFWSWYFDGKTMKTYEGELVYPYRPECLELV